MHLGYTSDTFTPSAYKMVRKENLNIGFKSRGLNAGNIREKIEMMYLISKWKIHKTKKGKNLKYRLQFITLTLSKDQVEEDKKITKKLLNDFLNNMRNVYYWRNYLWVAEKQQNGNIHYHIITDSNTSYWTVLINWNRIQEKYGYHKKIGEGKGIWENMSNSVDVRRVGNIKKIKYYLSKYVTKTHSSITGLYKGSGSHSEFCRTGSFLIEKGFGEQNQGIKSNKSLKEEVKCNNPRRFWVRKQYVDSRISGNSNNLSTTNVKEFQNCGDVNEEFYKYTPEESKVRVDYGYYYKISIFKLVRLSEKFRNWLQKRMKAFNFHQSNLNQNQWSEDQLILLYG